MKKKNANPRSKQYCRYCSELTTGNGIWCERRKKVLSEQYAKSVNRCQYFDFNPIDAFFENERGYKPREPKAPIIDNQIRLEFNNGNGNQD